jgi:ketosteroid isomerase-like protein
MIRSLRNESTLLRNCLLALFAVAWAVAPAAASEKSEKADIMATVNQFNDGMNKGDIKTALATCAAPSSIIDEFPPHEWQGATACADWANDFDAYNKKNGITDSIATLGKPRHVDVTGDRAYVVVPATYTYKQNGKPVTESGSTLTVALQKVAAGWRMTGWAWTKH